MLGQSLLSLSVSQPTLENIQGIDIPDINVIATLHLCILNVSDIARKQIGLTVKLETLNPASMRNSHRLSAIITLDLADGPTNKNQKSYSERQDAI